MSDKKETWKNFTIICNRCGRHEDEGVRAAPLYGINVQIVCLCGQRESYDAHEGGWMMEKEIVDKFDELDVETRVKLLLQYITALRGGVLNTGKMLENVDVNVAMKNAYKKLEQIMNIE